jgi:phospholipid/cholesterol/gamma-HCH transport system substrate-binding protein
MTRLPARLRGAFRAPPSLVANPAPQSRQRRRPPARSRSARLRLARAVIPATVVALAGCSSGGFNGIYNLPLPGGASLGSHPYQVTAVFSDALDLVPQSAVRVNNVPVGRVTRIWLPKASWFAHVSMEINGSVHLPANSIAEIAQSNLLGEQYVELAPPTVGGQGTLRGGATIPVYRTTSNATVEEVLGALSLLLNGGGLAQLHTITLELSHAFNGDEPQIRSMLVEINKLLANLNAHRADIITALRGLNQLAVTLRARDRQIGFVLDKFTPGLAVLNQQRSQLVTLLDALHQLSNVAVSTINQSQAQTVADLQALDPTLTELANAGQALPQSLEVLLTYPFTDQVLNAIKGDYLNAYLNVRARKGTCVYAPLPVPTSGETTPPLPTPGKTCPPQP